MINEDDPSVFEPDGSNELSVSAGTYTVTELFDENYTTSYDNCEEVEIGNGETATCVITNTYLPPPPPPPEPLDTTPPVSQFDNSRNHEIVDTELVALSLTGSSTDDFPGVKSGVASSTLKIFRIADASVVQSSNFNKQFEEMSCGNSQEQIPIEIVAMNLVGLDPLPLNAIWSHNWTPQIGVYCFEVYAKDKAGNEEHTAIAGPFAYTFTPPTPPPTPPSTPSTPPSDGGSPQPGGHRRDIGGSVAGASTVGQVLGESCGLYMDRFVRSGVPNNAEQVTKLQKFLNKWMNAGLPETGVYGPMSLNAVDNFQAKYANEILKPWSINAPTGIVYHTTLRWINMLECPDLALQIPALVPWSANPALPQPAIAKTPTLQGITLPKEPASPASPANQETPASPEVQSQPAAAAQSVTGGFWSKLKNKLFGN